MIARNVVYPHSIRHLSGGPDCEFAIRRLDRSPAVAVLIRAYV